MAQGIQVVRHWTGQPMFSWGLLAGGAVVVAAALIPDQWVLRLVTLKRR
jgi:hypothetical protein